MHRKPFTLFFLLALVLLSAIGTPALSTAACTAGNPNANASETTPSADFTINGDGTVTHAKTGLMWKRCMEGRSGAACGTGRETDMSWDMALRAANTANAANGGLGFANHTDWRLPNQKELQSIVEYCGYDPSINQEVFPATYYSFWSASSYVPDPRAAWNVDFTYGYVGPFDKTDGLFVRLVRGGQSLDSFDGLTPTYGVTYSGNGSTGGSVPVDGNAYAPAAIVTVLGNTGSLVKSGYSFSGWNTAANGSGTAYAGGATFGMPAANVTLYAQWTLLTPTYGVTYSGNGSTGGSVPVDGNAYAPAATVTVLGNTGALVKSGYSFSGWNTAANGSGTAYVGGATFSMPTANVTLHAQWTLVTYGVTYNGNGSTGGSVPVDGTAYAPAATVTVLGNTGSLVKSGYSFNGWNTAANGSGTAYAGGASFSMPAANVTLYAQWTLITYSVTYDGNGSTGGSVPVDGAAYAPTATVTVLGNTGALVKSGYSFNGWNTAANGSGTAYAGGATFSMPAANVTLFAQWTLITYSVTYNGNGNTGGGVPVDPDLHPAAGTVLVRFNTGAFNSGQLVKNGFDFAGWNTLANGTGTAYAGGATFSMPAADVTLYAQWATINRVTYNGNGNTGGSVPVDGTVYSDGATVTVLGNTGALVKSGYIFSGWNDFSNGSGTTYPVGTTFTIFSNKTLYAKWTQITYSVTYDGNGSTGGSVPVDAGAYAPGHFVSVQFNTGALVKSGYGFNGWNTAADGSGGAYSGGAHFEMSAANVTFYAQWAIPHGVTYDGNGSTGGSVPVDGAAYVPGVQVTVRGNPGSLTRTGYRFAGWYTTPNGSVTALTFFDMPAANVTLYAQWGHVVTYSGNGNTDGTVPIDAEGYVPARMVQVLGNEGGLAKSGLGFDDWNTAADGTGSRYGAGNTFVIGADDVTLYAQWRTVGLPDTGQTLCDDGANNLVACTLTNTGDAAAYPRQDARFGRDAKAAAGTLTKVGGGDAGFDYTKVANNGSDLAADAALGYNPGDWACTRDNITGLVWEVKTDYTKGLLYSWSLTVDPGPCNGALNYACNVDYFASTAQLCGFNDWRVPSVRELQTLANDGTAHVDGTAYIDTAYFPNTMPGAYWSAASFGMDSAYAWSVSSGASFPILKTGLAFVRLVRGGRF